MSDESKNSYHYVSCSGGVTTLFLIYQQGYNPGALFDHHYPTPYHSSAYSSFSESQMSSNESHDIYGLPLSNGSYPTIAPSQIQLVPHTDIREPSSQAQTLLPQVHVSHVYTDPDTDDYSTTPTASVETCEPRSKRLALPYHSKVPQNIDLHQPYYQSNTRLLKSYPCSMPACQAGENPPIFARAADLNRHMNTVHSSRQPMDCPWGWCGRVGSCGFTRKDHLKEHLRAYHKAMDSAIPPEQLGRRYQRAG